MAATTTTLTPTAPSSEPPKLVKKASSADIRNAITPTPTSYGCAHIKALLQAARQQATDQYARIIHSLHHDGPGSGHGHVSARTHKTAVATETSARTTYLCLQCPNVTPNRERHRKDHPFSIESSAGFLYCHDCHDFVYDPTFEDLRTARTSRKRKHAALAPDDRRLVTANSTATPCAAVGLRGLYNMGQTCFMSVILQALIHNPLLRAFYLSEGHKSAECERDCCTSCALDDIYTDFYGQEKREGYGAVHMLQSCWKGGRGLAGYSQQDAHEYLGFILNSLHTANLDNEDEDAGRGRDATDCDCVVHQAFGGLLRSTVTCLTCKNVTSTSDLFMDLSLDIPGTTVSVIKKKKLSMIQGTTTIKEVLPMELSECLDRFTAPETLSADAYRCRHCADGGHEARKRLTLLRLPPVVPIHLKRFAHSRSLKESAKVGTKVRFPLILDLAPYATHLKRRSKSGSGPHKPASTTAADPPDADLDPDAPSAAAAEDYPLTAPLYDLSAVVVHKGRMDSGHYIAYARPADNGTGTGSASAVGATWCRFDDSMVVRVDEREVLAAEAYMLFYVARAFDV